jgi:thioredoxin reductase (NADPH)
MSRARDVSASPLPETPDHDGAYPRLNDDQLARLSAVGRTRPTTTGEILFREGDEDYDFIVVLEGKVAIIQGEGDDQRLIAVHGPRRFLGELGMLTGQAAFFTAVVHEAGSVLEVPVDRLYELATNDSALGDLILRAYLIRREFLIGLGAGLKIVGSRYSPQARALRDLCARNRVPHRWIDLEEDASAEDLLRRLGVSPQETPVVIWHGSVLRNPSPDELASAIGLPDLSTAVELADLVVVGAGPAGLAAAVYGASEGLGTVVLDAVATGGQAATSSRIENYLGFPAGLSGAELAERATIQARKFGARLAVPATAVALERSDGHYVIRLASGQELQTRSVVIATGARYRRLQVPRLEELEPTSVYYAATLMEAQRCAGVPVVVVGGGNSAGQSTTLLARQATQVHLVLREDDLEVNMSRYLADRIRGLRNVDVRPHSEVRELLGDRRLEAVVVEDLVAGARDRLEAEALFVFIGAEPCTEWLRGVLALDDGGYVITGSGCSEEGRRAMLLESTLPGVLAVGDVRSGSIKRVASAVGEGSMAVRLVHEHLGTLG